MDNNLIDYSKFCTCGNFQPYMVFGTVAMVPLQPFGSCINCYGNNLVVNNPWSDTEALREHFEGYKSTIDTMSPEERERFLYGSWYVSKEEGDN